MKIFIWKRIKEATDHYHTEGGVVVIAKSENSARHLANNWISEESYNGNCKIYDGEQPDLILDCVGDIDPTVFVFPDAGCCRRARN